MPVLRFLNEKNSAQRDAHTTRRLQQGEAKKIPPAADSFPGAQDGKILISWRWSLPSPTDPVRWRSMHAISSYRGNRPTNKHTPTNPHTNSQTGPNTIHCAAKLSAQCNCVLWCVGQFKKNSLGLQLISTSPNTIWYKIIWLCLPRTMQTHINSAIADVFEWSMSCQLLEISQDKISEESTFHLFSDRQA